MTGLLVKGKYYGVQANVMHLISLFVFSHSLIFEDISLESCASVYMEVFGRVKAYRSVELTSCRRGR